MKKEEKKSSADTFYNSLKGNPEAIIEWCKDEIREYQKLIKLIKSKLK